jgi:hypothetical protein
MPYAVAFGAGLIAAAILVSSHWQVAYYNPESLDAVLLNRWTGSMRICSLNPKTIGAANSLVGAEFICAPLK